MPKPAHHAPLKVVLRETLDLAGSVDPFAVAVVRTHLGRALRRTGRDKAALTEFTDALRSLPAEDVDNRATLHRLIGDVLLESGDLGPATRHFEQLLDLAAAHGDSAGPWPELCLRAHSGLAHVAAALGRRAEEIDHLETAQEYAVLLADDERIRQFEARPRRARETGAVQPEGPLAAFFTDAATSLDAGDFDAAVDEFRALIDAAERAGDLGVRAEVTFRLALSLDRRERREEACEAFARAADLAAEFGDEARKALALANQGALEDAPGRRDEAVAHLRRAADLQRRVGTVYDLAWSLRQLAGILLSLGEPVDFADELVAVHHALDDPELQATADSRTADDLPG